MLKFLVFSVISMVFLVSTPELSAQSESTSSSATNVSEQKFVPGQEQTTLTAKGNTLRFDSDDFVVKRLDLNKDGKPDVVNVFKKVPNGKTGETQLRIYVKMMDLNHDSKLDLWRFFDIDSGAVIKEELDLDFDGRIDRTDYYINGVVRRSEFDFQFDKTPDIVKSFDEKGAVILIESDENGDGKPDYWEYYKNGVMERMEKDLDGDGKSDVFKRPGDSGFTGIVDVDARFEIPEETAQQENTENSVSAGEAASTNEVKPEADAEEPKTEEQKTEEAKTETAAAAATESEVQPEAAADAGNNAVPEPQEQSDKAE